VAAVWERDGAAIRLKVGFGRVEVAEQCANEYVTQDGSASGFPSYSFEASTRESCCGFHTHPLEPFQLCLGLVGCTLIAILSGPSRKCPLQCRRYTKIAVAALREFHAHGRRAGLAETKLLTALELAPDPIVLPVQMGPIADEAFAYIVRRN